MSIAVFKNKTFQVSNKGVYTFNDLVWNGSLQTEAQEKLNNKSSTFIKGIDLNRMNFKIPLKLSLGVNPRNEIEEWEAIRDSAQPAIFMLGNRPLGSNKWLLKSASIEGTTVVNDGIIAEATLNLEFEEFVRPGSAENSSNGSNSKKAVAVNANIPPSDYIYKPPSKDQQVRDNTNLARSLAAGMRRANNTSSGY